MEEHMGGFLDSNGSDAGLFLEGLEFLPLLSMHHGDRKRAQ